jgi:hypothetical protein
MNFLKTALGALGGFAGGIFGLGGTTKLLAAVGLGALLMAAGAYVKGRLDGGALVEARYAAEKVRILKERDVAKEAARAADEARAEADQKALQSLQVKANDTPKNDNVCLDRAGAQRVRRVRP